MNISSALFAQIIRSQDSETWASLRKDYLPAEYHPIFSVVEKHCDNFHSIPSFDDLKLGCRDSQTREKIFAIESVEVDVDASVLLEYLKNEYTQKEALNSLEKFVEHSIAFESAEETIEHLHEIVLELGNKVELEDPSENMQRMELWDSEEELGKYLPLGLNKEYDQEIKFSPHDLILIGGRRGAGKSIVCANIVNSVYDRGKSSIYFTIEMDSRSTMQRIAAIGAGIPANKLKHKNLSHTEWVRLATWWAGRYEDSGEALSDYNSHHSFDKLQADLSRKYILKPKQQIDIVYDPELTIGNIIATLDKKIKTIEPAVVVVDYINQVKRSSMLNNRNGQYDWTEQIEVSKKLKSIAQEYNVPIVSPYQIDSSGEARFSKGILDAADGAFVLNPWSHEDGCISFDCTKIRNDAELSFTSTMNWDTLAIGPDSAQTPKEKEDEPEEGSEPIHDI